MKLADVIGALRRQWYVVLAGILVAAGVSALLWSTVPPQYERTGTQLLLPGHATIPENANPYLFVGGLYQIADVVVRAIGPEDVAEATRDHPGTDVVVGRDQAAGAVLVVTVTAPSDADAAAVLDAMLQVTGRTLDGLQDAQRIPADERVVITPLTSADTSTVIQKTRMTLTALAGAAVLLLALGAAVLLDGTVRARRRARIGAASREEASDTDTRRTTAGVGDEGAGVPPADANPAERTGGGEIIGDAGGADDAARPVDAPTTERAPGADARPGRTGRSPGAAARPRALVGKRPAH